MGTKTYLMTRKIILILCVFFLVSILVAFDRSAIAGQLAESPPDARLQAYERIGAASRNLQTILSDFVQEKHLAVLKNPLLSKGRFGYQKPDTLYWEVVEPAKTGFSVTGGKAKRWASDQKSFQTFSVEKEPLIKAIVEQIFAWARADFPWLEKRYRITVTDEKPTELKLVPLSSNEKKYISYLLVMFSEQWAQLNAVEIHEISGDFTRITFINMLQNNPLPKGYLE